MPAAKIVERYTAEAIWTASSAIYLGGDERFGQNADMVLARDARNRFYIPGSSIAGAGRSYLARNKAITFEEFKKGTEYGAMEALFGKGLVKDSKASAYASLLHVHESILADSKAIGWVRDRVRIDGDRGSARAKGKFNLEVLPAGTSFPLRAQLTVYDNLPHAIGQKALLDAFGRLLFGFSGEIALGGHSRRGLGAGAVRSWKIRRFDTDKREHVFAWLQNRGWDGGDTIPIEQLLAGVPDPTREQLTIRLSLALRGPLLIRGGVAVPNNPDFVHFSEHGQPLIPGSSLAGALRHRSHRIAATLWGADKAAEVVSQLFGPTIEQARHKLFAGRLRIGEGLLHHGKYKVQSRVKIDRFTGGSIETALFDEAPFWPDANADSHCEFKLVLDADLGKDRQLITLLLQTVKDLWLGDLPLGGETSHGRGVFEGRAATINYTSFGELTLIRTGTGGTVESRGWNRQWSDLVEAGLHVTN